MNKFAINLIKILLPNLKTSFYLSIIINESIHLKTKLLDFKTTNSIEINQIFELDNTIQSIESIKFSICEKNSIFSNVTFRGEYSLQSKLFDETTNSHICFLSDNNKDNGIVVYFRYELNVDLLGNFEDNLKTLNEDNKAKTKIHNNSSLDNFMGLASGENAANFTKFVKNMEYLKLFYKEFINIIYWKDKWKTLSFALILNLIVFVSLFSKISGNVPTPSEGADF